MSKKGILIILSGFSGAGKGTVVKRLMERYDGYALSVSVTTRAAREGEVEGKDYFFRTPEQFEEMLQADALIEHARYVGNDYGTPRSYVEQQLLAGKDVILEIEVQGALEAKQKYPDAVLIFITPPDAKELERRLIGRNTNDMADVISRMKRAAEEADYLKQYEGMIINDDLEQCAEELHWYVQSEHRKTCRNNCIIETIKQELESYAKGEL